MSNSYLLGGAVAGMNVRVAGPNGYLPDPQIVADAEAIASETGGSVLVTTDPKEAVAGATACSPTHGFPWAKNRNTPSVPSVLGLSGERRTHVLCQGRRHLPALPAGIPCKEVTSEVIDGPQSVVWDEAGNRLHAQKALLTWLAGKARGDESLLA